MLFSSQDAFAASIFKDDFSLDPASNGWTEEIIGGAGSDNISPIVFPNIQPHTNPDHGTEVFFEKDSSGATTRIFNIKQIISTVCFENIKISLTAHQLAGAYEPVDFLEIRVDTNGDGIFEPVLKDVERWDGVEDQHMKDLGKAANTSPKSTGFIPLPNAATNNPNLNIKIQASFNSLLEGYFLTEVEVIGDAIQGNCNVIGGNILEIDNYALFVAAVGTNPVITGLVGITLAGVAGQALWFVHRRKNS